MRVLMISKACIVGTYQKKLEAMAEAAQDLALTVVVPPFWRDERGVTRLERAHTNGYRLTVLPAVLNGSFHLHFYPRLARVIQDVQPDLVHIDEEPYNLATYHANVLAHRAGARTIWFSWQNLTRRYPFPFSKIERYNLRHVEHAIVGSRTSAEVWRAKGYGGPLTVIPQFGVDPEVFHPPLPSGTVTPRGGTSLHIAYVGRLVPEKGIDVLLDALVPLQGSWRATLLGSGPAERELRERVNALGLADRVTFRPWLPSTAMPDFYRQADILVLPSRGRSNWTEQFGRVLIEAMACEAAVVGSDVGEIPHVIGDAGCVFPEADAGALGNVLDELIKAPALRRDLGARGRARVLNHFTQQEVARATLAVYRATLDVGRK
ncbi:MAG: glycosyltransferase family 4 protein [Anaerolineae bacterium]|nr:glycosyltransferase family 4 protein [Anaerolineae bacterium]